MLRSCNSLRGQVKISIADFALYKVFLDVGHGLLDCMHCNCEHRTGAWAQHAAQPTSASVSIVGLLILPIISVIKSFLACGWTSLYHVIMR